MKNQTISIADFSSKQDLGKAIIDLNPTHTNFPVCRNGVYRSAHIGKTVRLAGGKTYHQKNIGMSYGELIEILRQHQDDRTLDFCEGKMQILICYDPGNKVENEQVEILLGWIELYQELFGEKNVATVLILGKEEEHGYY